MSTEIEFKVRTGDEWVLAKELSAEQYVHQLLQVPNLSCCNLSAGFFITINGKAWNGPDSVDEYGNAESWLDAIEHIIEKKDVWWVKVWAWEESNCEVRLKDG